MDTEYRADEPAPDFPSEDEPYTPGLAFTGHVIDLTVVESKPSRKRRIGFVTEDDYVRGGVVMQYKSRRSPKRAKPKEKVRQNGNSH